MLLAVLIGCHSGSVGFDERSLLIEDLASESEGLGTSGPAVVYAQSDDWAWLDPRGDQPIPFGVSGRVRDAAEARGQRFVLAERVHVLLDDTAIEVGDVALADRAIRNICGDGHQLWLTMGEDAEAPTGVVIWRGDVLADLLLGQQPATGPLACGGRHGGQLVSWVADGDELHAISAQTVVFEVVASHTLPGLITAVAVDALGLPWVVVDDRLHRLRDGQWTTLRLRSPVRDAVGGQQSRGVWALTDDGPMFVPAVDRPTAVRPSVGPGIDTAPVGRVRSDDLGRLLVRDDDGLHRVSVGRPLWVDGLPDRSDLTDAIEVRLYPTLPDDVTDLTATVIEADVSLPVADNVVLIDPVTLPPGVFTLAIQVTYADGALHYQERSIGIPGAPGVSWRDDIQRIHEGSCALCHTNSAETVLDGPDAWQAQFDTLLDQVQSGAMPLGRPDLSAGEIALIEGWAEGGFQR